MKTEIIEGILTLKIDMVTTLTLAVLMFLSRDLLKKKVSFFERFCIPAPVIGGLFLPFYILF